MAEMPEEKITERCIKVFGEYVKKEKAKELTEDEKKIGKGTTVKKILQSLGEGPDAINKCDASIMPKYQDKRTKTITAEDFVNKLLPDFAGSDKKLNKLRKDMSAQLESLQEAKQGKSAAVVDRLTDTSKYTGSHGARFDESGKGKGKAGREELVANDGYVTGYKEKDTYGKKK